MSIIVVAIAAFVAIGSTLLSIAAAAVFRKGMLIPKDLPQVPVTLLMAATGPLPHLDSVFTALRAQTLPPARLIVSVESESDPAYRRVGDLASRYPDLVVDIVVAGRSEVRAQKLTNLLAAFARLRDTDRYLVMLDADIRPQPWWLAALVGPLAAGTADIVSGYRWPIPGRLTIATTIVTAIDRAVALLPWFGAAGGMWGGSMAMTKQTLDRLDMASTLARAITEDLVIADRALALGLRLVIRRGVRVPTPLRGSATELWRFGRRQMQCFAVYRRRFWLAALLCHSGELAARVFLFAALVDADAAAVEIAAGSLIALALLGSAVTEIRRSIGRRLAVPDRWRVALAQHILAWTILPALVFYVSVIWASIVYSPVRWAHIRYTMDARGRVRSASRFSYLRDEG
jgi:cellulose synthase/poly-beta-1,6-N-acetylglucosamine synthase-like glycosyltransferase